MTKKRTLASLELSSMALRICGLVCLAAGCISSLIQDRILSVGQISNSELFELISDLPHGMTYATVSVVCQVLELCAVPIFAFLLAEGAVRTASFGKYFLRVFALALVCEIPYNLLTDGSFLGPGDLNPVFGPVMTLAMLYFFRTYGEKKAGHTAVKAIAVLGAFLWCNFLGVAFGASCVVITAALWATRGKQNIQLIVGCAASMACSVFSPLYIFTPISFLVIHLYSGERGRENRLFSYLAYPLMLVLFLLISRIAG